MRPKGKDYAAALDELEQLRRDGKITQGRYDMHRSKLLAEMNRQPLSWPIRFMLIVGFFVTLFFVLRLLNQALGG